MTSENHLVIVDVESTCWEKKPPPGQQNEIIEIGVSVFDLSSLTPDSGVSILVKPQRSKVSAFCTTLTTLTQEQVDTGIPFDQACARLEAEFDTKARIWASWGTYDLRIFRDQCASFGVPYPFGEQHINLKHVFADRMNDKKQLGMAAALKFCDLSLEGTHHRGGDDAYNIGRILAVLLKHVGIQNLIA